MSESFITSRDQAAIWRNEMDAAGKRVVFTNGCFDLLHAGHVRYLKEARALGDALVVAINSDESVRELKGEGRPVHNAEDRAEILCALEAVDKVVVYGEKRATASIESVRPHIYTKGGDYTADNLIDEEKALLDRLGIDIRILSLVPGRSTRSTLEKMAGDSSRDEKPKIAILGSGTGSNAQSIIDAVKTGDLDADIAVIMSDVAGAGILGIAEREGIPSLDIDPGTTKGGHLTDAALKEIADRLKSYRVDLVVLAGFMRILREPLLSRFENRILNIHPSLLPKYPGLNTFQRAIDAEESETGTTIHVVDSGLDTGEIVAQGKVSIDAGDNAASLQEKVKSVEHKLYPQVIGEYLQKC
ncbi:MAG: phosphoribosylglycinamide formyltransferase [Verrucomicrobiota bacterium]